MQLLAALQARNAMGGVPPGGAPGAVSGGPPAPAMPPPGAGMPGPGGPGGGPGGPDAGSDFSSMLSDLRRADPNVHMNQVKQIKQIFAAMLVHNLEPNPAAAGKIAKIIPHMDAIIKEFERAASVSGAVRQPIQMGAAMPTAASGGPATGTGPGTMGAMPAAA